MRGQGAGDIVTSIFQRSTPSRAKGDWVASDITMASQILIKL